MEWNNQIIKFREQNKISNFDITIIMFIKNRNFQNFQKIKKSTNFLISIEEELHTYP